MSTGSNDDRKDGDPIQIAPGSLLGDSPKSTENEGVYRFSASKLQKETQRLSEELESEVQQHKMTQEQLQSAEAEKKRLEKSLEATQKLLQQSKERLRTRTLQGIPLMSALTAPQPGQEQPGQGQPGQGQPGQGQPGQGQPGQGQPGQPATFVKSPAAPKAYEHSHDLALEHIEKLEGEVYAAKEEANRHAARIEAAKAAAENERKQREMVVEQLAEARDIIKELRKVPQRQAVQAQLDELNQQLEQVCKERDALALELSRTREQLEGRALDDQAGMVISAGGVVGTGAPADQLVPATLPRHPLLAWPYLAIGGVILLVLIILLIVVFSGPSDQEPPSDEQSAQVAVAKARTAAAAEATDEPAPEPAPEPEGKLATADAAAEQSTDASPAEQEAQDMGPSPDQAAAAPRPSARPKATATRKQKHKRHIGKAIILIRRQKYDEARKHLTLALKIADTSQARRLLAISHERAGEIWPAIHHLQKAIPKNRRTKPILYDKLGRLYLKVKKTSKACESFRMAVKLDPKLKRTQTRLNEHCKR